MLLPFLSGNLDLLDEELFVLFTLFPFLNELFAFLELNLISNNFSFCSIE